MQKVISLLNIKGGVGKTMACINIAGEMSRLGLKVIIIDNDPQSNASQRLDIRSQYTMYDLYSNPKITFEDCIVNVRENVYIVPNSIESAMLEIELQNRNTRELILRNKLKNSNIDFDYILIDNSPYLGLCVKNSLAISDYYLEVIDNDVSALQGLNMVKRVVKEMIEDCVVDDLKLLGIFRNKFDKRSNFSKDFNDVVQFNFKNDLFESIAYESVKYKEAAAYNKFIQEYSEEHSKPYKLLVDEMLRRMK